MELKDVTAPISYGNWKACIEKLPLLGVEEIPLFSDAHLVGDFKEDCGPYRFVHVIHTNMQCGVAKPVLLLRYSQHLDVEVSSSDMEKTNVENYHGGRPVDEVAALTSLALGVRLKAGDVNRVFVPKGDPFGDPKASRGTGYPTISLGDSGLVMPNICGLNTHINITEALNPFVTLPKIRPSDATALIKSARLYQNALWTAESEPSLAWVMLVSAVETAANYWRCEDASFLEIMKDADPDLHDILAETGIEDLPSKVAGRIAHTMKSTKKFLDFCMEFLPSPPLIRPEKDNLQHKWTPKALKKTLRVIYDYRSRALHDGRPFPAPMCNAPLSPNRETPEEVPLWIAYSEGNAVWQAKDVPIMLHTFEHFVRESLLKWWTSMIRDS